MQKPFEEAHFATFPKTDRPAYWPDAEGGTVLDPFMGAGATAVVVEHNRNYIGFELNPEYVAIAEKRLAGTVQQAANLRRDNMLNRQEAMEAIDDLTECAGIVPQSKPQM